MWHIFTVNAVFYRDTFLKVATPAG